MSKVIFCPVGKEHLPPDVIEQLPELLDELAEAMHNIARSMVLCTCIAYLCTHRREEIEAAILDDISEAIGAVIGKAIGALIVHVHTVGAAELSAPVFDAHMREFMFTVRAEAERYIADNGLEVKAESS